ncbi:hypothetical protein [Gimesia sp.]|uniref:hypothetical protein n=1 Tax=Gimesia sp. TaxID=2024833 RepID=UPI003A959303
MYQVDPLFKKHFFFCTGMITLLLMWYIDCLRVADGKGSGISNAIALVLFVPVGGKLLSAKQYLLFIATLLLCLAVGFGIGSLIETHLMTLSLSHGLIVSGIGGLLGLLEYGLLWLIMDVLSQTVFSLSLLSASNLQRQEIANEPGTSAQ